METIAQFAFFKTIHRNQQYLLKFVELRMRECFGPRVHKLSVEELIKAGFPPLVFYSCFDRLRVGCLYYWIDG